MPVTHGPHTSSPSHPAFALAAALLLLALLGPVQTAAAQSGSRYYVQAATTAYSETSSLSAPVAALEAGREVEALERWASWVRVRFGPGPGDSGWVVVQKLGRAPPEGVAPSVPEPAAEDFLLRIGADETRSLRITCDVIDAGGAEVERGFQGETPAAIRFDGARAVSCRVRDRLRSEAPGLHAELQHGGRSLLRIQTDAVFARELRLRSAGPWGPARAEACRTRAYVLQEGALGTTVALECRSF